MKLFNYFLKSHTVRMSAEALSRQDKKLALSNEQDASLKRIGQYWRRWLGLALFAQLIFGSALVQAEIGDCDTYFPHPTSCECRTTDNTRIFSGFWFVSAGPTLYTGRNYTSRNELSSLCSDQYDTVCGISPTTHGDTFTGDTIYVKNAFGTDYFKCAVTLGVKLNPEPYIPTPPPTPILSEVTVVPTPGTDTTPDYTFSTDEDGDITYGGSCSSSTTTAAVGNNTITFNTLATGTFNDCTITVTVSSVSSDPLDVTEFIIDIDTDGDGTGNLSDTDDDGDGVLDGSDAFPLDATESVDTDSDGTGDNADTDDDGDTIADSTDNCPMTANSDQADSDGDGIGDECDSVDNNANSSGSSSGTPARTLPEELNVVIKFEGEGTVKLDSRVCKSENERCEYELKVAKHYSLKAIPAGGYEFSHWTGNKTCSDGDIFLINNTVCQAVFKEKVSETANSAGSSSNSDGSSDSNGSTGSGVISDNYRPVNMGTRAKIMGGANNIIAGFILQGSGQQTVMLQGLALEELVDPVITVNKFPSGDLVATNDNWQDAENADKIPDNLKLPMDSDAGLLLDLIAGGYTINFGSNNESGIGLVSVNIVDDENGKYTNDLINLSTRASIQGGANDVIAGFIIHGNETQKVLINTRGLKEGVDTTLKLQKYPSGDTVAENDNWQDADNSGDITISLNDTDAALLLDLPAGAYTAIMSSNGEKGLGIVEVNIVQ